MHTGTNRKANGQRVIPGEKKWLAAAGASPALELITVDAALVVPAPFYTEFRHERQQ